MVSAFITVLNMSLTGAFVISVVCLARVLLRKNLRRFMFCLWVVVGFRLMFPFSIESVFSLIPFSGQLISLDIAAPVMPYADGVLRNNPLQAWMAIGSYIWLTGVMLMLLYDIASYVFLRRDLTDAVHIDTNIYETKKIKTPFVLGIFAPKIYLPANLATRERQYIVLHEQMHVKRYDHIVKLVAYLILCLHWFNPLAWLAFFLICRDIEMACDECVLRELGGGAVVKKDYSSVLLSLVSEQRAMSGSSLAFVNSDISLRIKNVLSLKKHSAMIFAASTVLVVMLSIGLLVSRTDARAAVYNTNSEATGQEFLRDWCCD